ARRLNLLTDGASITMPESKSGGGRRSRAPRSPATPGTDLRAAEPRNGALRSLEEEEPLSLAEQLVDAAERGLILEETDEQFERIRHSDLHIAELQKMSMPQLIEEARKDNLKDYLGIKKQDLIYKILKERVKVNGLMYGEGTLEILPDGF